MADATRQQSEKPLERILIVTGRLAEPLARRVAAELTNGFDCHVEVVGISVAALMHVDWLLRKLTINSEYDRVILPGWCQGDLDKLQGAFSVPFERGPKDLQELPGYLSGRRRTVPRLTAYDVEILAEVNHAPLLSETELIAQAQRYRRDGADIIDLGCVPGARWSEVGAAVQRLRSEGFRVSIDSFDRVEVEAAVASGAELVLSCNSTNVDWAKTLPAEVILIPDDLSNLEALDAVREQFQQARGRFRLDAILEPVGFGFAASLARYFETRRRYPDDAMLMGIGNVTELADVDSAGLNFLLAAICQELRIHSVLTTEVINWCRTSVAEFDRARKLVKYAIEQRVPPKHLNDDLVILRDPDLQELEQPVLDELAAEIRDPNYRIFVERGEIHVINRDGYWRGRDAYELFDQFRADRELDASHAFYLGYELSKAVTALTLGKQYRQDEALRWGFLTVPEPSAHERRRRERRAGEP